MDWNVLPLEPRHLGVPSGAFRLISEPIVCLVQTGNQSCTDPNTVSKWTKMRFHMTHITKQFHRIHPKQILSLWYVWRKLCTYLARTQTMSPNKPKRDCTWPMSCNSSIGCVQNDFWAYSTFSQTVHLSCTDTNTISKRTEWGSTWPTSPRSSIGCFERNFWDCAMFSANCAPFLCQD
jgi:hypothetical protein